MNMLAYQHFKENFFGPKFRNL